MVKLKRYGRMNINTPCQYTSEALIGTTQGEEQMERRVFEDQYDQHDVELPSSPSGIRHHHDHSDDTNNSILDSLIRQITTISQLGPSWSYPYTRLEELSYHDRSQFRHSFIKPTTSILLMITLPFILVFSYFFFSSPTYSKSPIEITQRCSFTGLGIVAKGLSTSEGACRYTVRYGMAERWGESEFAMDNIKNQSFSDLPPTCPQSPGSYVSGNDQSEDCLFATIYIPQSATLLSKLPVFVWLHGGSYIAGSASAPGLDGSKLAVQGNIIVVILQYRLGVLGFLPPSSASSSSDPNLGLKDVILALKGIQKGIGFVGGDEDRVTIGGQSSGAGLIRALLGVPNAKGLFRAAIVQSDPMSYGNSPTSITTKLQNAFYSQEPMNKCTDLKCLQNIPSASIIAAQNVLLSTAPLMIQGLPISMPIRPTFGNPTLPSDPTVSFFTSPSDLPLWDIPLLVTTVANEAGTAVSELFPAPVALSQDSYYATLAATIGAERAGILSSSREYGLPNATGYGEGGDVFRETYERAATEGIWTCPNRDVAEQWSRNGGKVWVGQWNKGVTYPSNDNNGYCKSDGRVCHEDDIYPTFGTSPVTYDEGTSLEEDVLSYWTSFITTLNPSPSTTKRDNLDCRRSLKEWLSWLWPFKRAIIPQRSSSSSSENWSPYISEDDVLAIGGGQISRCPEGFWGEKAKYDWQLYGQ